MNATIDELRARQQTRLAQVDGMTRLNAPSPHPVPLLEVENLSVECRTTERICRHYGCVAFKRRPGETVAIFASWDRAKIGDRACR